MTDIIPAGPSRRAVVRTGATLAWSVPAVVIASAVPAYAASGDTTLQVALAPVARSLDTTRTPPSRTRLTVSSTVTNTGSFDTRSLTVVLRVSASFAVEMGESTASDVVGFAPPVRSTTSTTSPVTQVSFTYVALAPLAPAATIVFDPVVAMQNETDGVVRVSASPGNGPTDEKSSLFN